MLKNRTISALRKTLKGRIYIYCANEKIGRQFLCDAEKEGYRFGKTKPTDSKWSNIIAVETNKQLSYVGFCGHAAFQCNGGSNSEGSFHRIDYGKFVNDAVDYFFRSSSCVYTIRFKSRLFRDVSIIGDKCKAAFDYIDRYILLCKSKPQEIALYKNATNLYDVVITDYKYF